VEREDYDEMIRIVTADGDPLARRGLRNALREEGLTVVAEATTGREAVDLTVFYSPDVLVVDQRLSELDGLSVVRAVRERFPDLRVLVLAAVPDEDMGLRALRMGACGYMSKDLEPGALLRAVRGALAGEAAISRRLAMRLVEEDRRTPRGGAGFRPVRSSLTDREWEVLDLLSSGAGTEDIARILVLSTETVRSHLKNLYRKLGVRSREEAVEAARRQRELVG